MAFDTTNTQMHMTFASISPIYDCTYFMTVVTQTLSLLQQQWRVMNLYCQCKARMLLMADLLCANQDYHSCRMSLDRAHNT